MVTNKFQGGLSMRINPKYKYETTPKANPKAIIQGDKYRFTILTPRLFRIEYSESGIFEDRATQIVINREFDLPEFTVSDTGDLLKITTSAIEITYTKEPLSSNSLSVCYVGKEAGCYAGRLSTSWHFGVENYFNLKATTRTLDDVDGACELEEGIMTRGEVSTLNDSNSLIIADDGVIETRNVKEDDYYIFCYGRALKNNNGMFDYYGCLNDFYKLTGEVPLLPRFAFGNWWSRYYAYSADEYMELMRRFKKEEIPFSVAVIDMDWHNVRIDSKYGTGWTGYSWNKDLFPDPEKFLKELKDENMYVTLNLHPQEGVGAHEDAYPEMAKAMGIDPKTEQRVEFDITNPKFIENYFEKLHHPLEKQGVDFWWIDWQQGNTTRVPGLDPLWMLNHYHTIDHKKEDRRPIMFSRYAGPGSHRYPVGFSGDTRISWESLKFQPYFTSTASNVGYGWWSHDIGGHGAGTRDDELTARWVQLGAFSPLLRLHSTNNPFLSKEPWNYNRDAEASMKKFLNLRHSLIPYLYTMNYRAHKFGEPLVQPLYYKWSNIECYENNENEYCFGTEMIVSPITDPHDEITTLGSVNVYFPEGTWFDFFTGKKYTGGRTVRAYRDLDTMPVFVKAGGIIPTAKAENINSTENPTNLTLKIFPDANGQFSMYEDDGLTMAYQKGKSVTTDFIYDWDNKEFTIKAPDGDTSLIPSKRNYTLEFVSTNTDINSIAITEDGKEKEFSASFEDGILTISFTDVSGEVKVVFNSSVNVVQKDIGQQLYELFSPLKVPTLNKTKLYNDILSKTTTVERVSCATAFNFGSDALNAVLEILTSCED